jgi:hypothetical protein
LPGANRIDNTSITIKIASSSGIFLNSVSISQKIEVFINKNVWFYPKIICYDSDFSPFNTYDSRLTIAAGTALLAFKA